MKILTTSNAKIQKAKKKLYKTAGIHLAPYTLGAVKIDGKLQNACPNATLSCKKYCLVSSGHGAFNNVKLARKRKTARFYHDLDYFMKQLHDEITSFIRSCTKAGYIPSLRLNLTSDIDYTKIFFNIDGGEYLNIFQHFPDVQFYDYTKSIDMALRYANDDLPQNYHITYSFDTDNLDTVHKGTPYFYTLKRMKQIAFIYNKDTPPNFDFTNGNEHDLTFLHGRFVGLYAIGKAKKVKFDNAHIEYVHSFL